MATAEVRVTSHLEFQTTDENHARDALVRLQGDVRHSIEFPSGIESWMTGFVPDSLTVGVAEKTSTTDAVATGRHGLLQGVFHAVRFCRR
jgi:hypothetical protein